jgi:hypothetical protein
MTNLWSALVTLSISRFFDARLGQVDGAVQQFKESLETTTLLEDTTVYDNIEVTDYESTRTLVLLQSSIEVSALANSGSILTGRVIEIDMDDLFACSTLQT